MRTPSSDHPDEGHVSGRPKWPDNWPATVAGALVVLVWLTPVFFAAQADKRTANPRADSETVGMEKRRVVVRVEPAPLAGRLTDERPAEWSLNAEEFAADRKIDLSTLRVVRCDPAGREEQSPPLPFRWYDNAVPYDFPECEQNIHATDGVTLTYEKRARWGDFYNLRAEGLGGRLVWLHRQNGAEPAHYAVSFDLLPSAKQVEESPPRGFVGDGSHRCRPRGASTTGMIHSRVAVHDWNGDRVPDLLIGGARGHVLFYANGGTSRDPRFGYARLITLAEGTPLDVGWSAAPFVADWDGDGLADLLCGAERNRIVYFRNEGTARAPRLVNRGFVTIDGKPLQLPVEPVPKSPPGVYQLDYYPVVDIADWNGDGRADLLAGGYITGRIFVYENSGRNDDGTPKLFARGPLEADGRVLNVGDWAAAPCTADFDGDGDLDLIAGNMAMTAGGGDSTDPVHFLRYYENVGSRTASALKERPFPARGEFPNANLGTPRAADWNGDGLVDLVVSAGENVFLYFNRGTAANPAFQVDAQPLPGNWGSAPLPTSGLQFLDWDSDRKNDLLCGLTIYRNQGDGDFRPTSLLPPGSAIAHTAPRGDPWMFTQLADLNGDGRLDLLFGTHEGEIWLHRQVAGETRRFDERGDLLLLENDQPLRVGPARGTAIDFDVLQGARTAFTVGDFDRDDRIDLVVGDTYGMARYFRNIGTKTEPRFAAPVVLGDLKIRMVPFAADWNRDGKLDVLGSAASGAVVLWTNLGDNQFSAAEAIPVPATPYSPSVAVADWNGDGDEDLIVGTAYGYFCWFERSFLDHGYAIAKPVRTTTP